MKILRTLIIASLLNFSATKADNPIVAAGSGIIAGAIAPLKVSVDLAHMVTVAGKKIAGNIYGLVGASVYSSLHEFNRVIYIGAYVVPAAILLYRASQNSSKRWGKWIIPAIWTYPALLAFYKGFDKELKH